MIMKQFAQVLTVSVILGFTATANAGAIQVGHSSLIGTLQYSDTYTTTANGGNAERVDGTSPVSSTGLIVENNYGHTSRTWTANAWGDNWSIKTDSSASTGYPGTSGAGSDKGITQNGLFGDWGFQYGLSTDFVIQTDAVQPSDRFDISVGSGVGIGDANTLSVFFGATGGITLFTGAMRGTDTGFTSGLTAGTWNNYAIRVNTVAKTIEVFTNEVSRGVIDVTSVGAGKKNYSSYLNNSMVSVGGCYAPGGAAILWTDNFQVGSAVPEPSTIALLATGLLGLLAYAWRKRK